MHDYIAVYMTISAFLSLLCAGMAVYSFATIVSRPVNTKDNWDWFGTSFLLAFIFLAVSAITLFACIKSIFLGLAVFICLIFPTRHVRKKEKAANKRLEEQ